MGFGGEDVSDVANVHAQRAQMRLHITHPWGRAPSIRISPACVRMTATLSAPKPTSDVLPKMRAGWAGVRKRLEYSGSMGRSRGSSAAMAGVAAIKLMIAAVRRARMGHLCWR
jgi:hypothetical protein